MTSLTHKASSRTRPDLSSESGLTLVEVIVQRADGRPDLALADRPGRHRLRHAPDQQRRIAGRRDRAAGPGADARDVRRPARAAEPDPHRHARRRAVHRHLDGPFLASASGADACTATGTGNADYARISSRVDWSSNRRSDVVQESIISPPRGGSLLAQMVDQNNQPLAGSAVTVTGADADTDAIQRQASTDSERLRDLREPAAGRLQRRERPHAATSTRTATPRPRARSRRRRATPRRPVS